MHNKLSQSFVIPCYDTDRKCRFRPASFMDKAQEMGSEHAEILGFGYDKLMETRVAWVLSREHIHFHKYPQWRDKVTLSTWHKGSEGLFYLRDFSLTDEEGHPMISAASSWLVLNIDTRHLSRATVLDNNTACLEDVMEHSCDKAQMPRGVEVAKVAEHVVSYSDIDMNGHTNNARYLVWAMDVLDSDCLADNPVSDIWITFNNETHEGETVDMYRVSDGEFVYVEGKVRDKSAFCVKFGWQ